MLRGNQLKNGVVIQDVLDLIEADVVQYMSTKRQLDEHQFRKLLDAAPEVRASYGRKIQRCLQSTGLNPTKMVG